MPADFENRSSPGDAGDDLGAREAARNRRRDREADAEARDLMRPGMGKVFKQIQDAQAKAKLPPGDGPRPKKRRPPKGR